MNYPLIPGIDPERTTLVNALAQSGITNPVTEEPYTEEWVLGLGGGLGSTYMLWEFKESDQVVVVLAFGYRANYPKEHLQNAVTRCGARLEIVETGGRKKALSDLAATLDAGRVAICTVDPFHLPHLQLPTWTDGCYGWVVNCVSVDDGVAVHDVGNNVRSIDMEVLATARARVGSFKNRLCRVMGAKETPRAETAVSDAIRECVAYLGSGSDSFGLASLRKWARLMTDRKHRKAWPVVFEDGTRLFGALSSVYRSIRHDGSAGHALRDLYAGFLSDAGSRLADPALAEAADAYRLCADAWERLADVVLPPAEFAPARRILDRRYALILNGDDATASEEAATRLEFDELGEALDRDCPLTEPQRLDLYAAISDAITDVYERELLALAALARCVGTE